MKYRFGFAFWIEYIRNGIVRILMRRLQILILIEINEYNLLKFKIRGILFWVFPPAFV